MKRASSAPMRPPAPSRSLSLDSRDLDLVEKGVQHRRVSTKARDYPNPSFGTRAAQEARRSVGRMDRAQRRALFDAAVAVANGQPVPKSLPRARRQHPH